MSPRKRGRAGGDGQAARFENRSGPEWDFFVAGDQSSLDTGSPIGANGSENGVSSNGGRVEGPLPATRANIDLTTIDLKQIAERLEKLEAAVAKLEAMASQPRVPNLPRPYPPKST